MRGFVYGAIASGVLGHVGMKGLQKLLNADKGEFKKLFTGVQGQVAEKSAFKGQGNVVNKFAREWEKNFANPTDIVRSLSKAEGEANLAADSFSLAIKNLRDKWSQLSPIQRDAVDAASFADPMTYPAALAHMRAQVPDPDVLSAVMFYRHIANEATHLAVAGLDPKSSMYRTIMDRIGTYQTRVYKIHFDPKYIPTEQAVENTIQELRLITSTGTGMLGNMMEYDVARSLVHKYLHDIYVDRGLQGFGKKFSHASKGAENLQDFVQKRIPELEKRPAFRQMMGEITDPIEVRAATALKLIAAVRSGQFFNEMDNAMTARGNQFAYSQDDWLATMHNLRARAQTVPPPPDIATLQLRIQELEHYVPAGDGEHLGKLAGKYIHRQVQDRLPGHDGIFEGNSGPLINNMIAVSNFYKTAKVGANPLSWSRTLLGMPFWLTVAGASPRDWWIGRAHMKARGQVWREFMQQGILSGGYGTGEMRKDLGMVLNPNLDEAGYKHLWNQWVHLGARIFDYADSTVRAAKYLREKENLYKQGVLIKPGTTGHTVGMTEQQIRDYATDQVNRYTPNYSTVPRGIRKLRQAPFVNQFLTYFYETARITKNLFEDVATNRNGNRWRAVATLSAIPAVFAGAQYIAENQLTDEEKQEWEQIKRLLPSYKRNGFLIPTKKNADGSFHFFNISPLFIADDLAKMVKAIAHGDWEGLKAVEPIFGWDNTPAITSAAALLGYDLRQGRKITLTEDRLDTVRKEMLPPLLGGYELDNFVKSLTRDKDGQLGIVNAKTGQRFKIADLLASYATGVRGQDINVNALVEREQYAVEEQIKALESKFNRLMLTNPPIEKQELAEQILQEKVKELIEDFQRKVNGPDVGQVQ